MSSDGEEGHGSRRPRRRRRATRLPPSVTVHQSMNLRSEYDDTIGEGVYVSVQGGPHQPPYHGILVQQQVLERASLQQMEDQARQRQAMERMHRQHNNRMSEGTDSRGKANEAKAAAGTTATATPTITRSSQDDDLRPIERYRYDPETKTRQLLATYTSIDALCELWGCMVDRDAVARACREGGNFCGADYYQYRDDSYAFTGQSEDASVSPPLTMAQFLQSTDWPPWFPSLPGMRHQDVQGLLDTSTNAVKDPDILPMEPRVRYRVIIIGGGMAGLSAALALLDQSQQQQVDLEVVLVEARDRLGGRLWTQQIGETSVDVGGSWIHGVDMNPLSALARQAGASMVMASPEDTVMLGEKARIIDDDVQEQVEDLFGRLLDAEATGSPGIPCTAVSQRWYAGSASSKNSTSNGASNSAILGFYAQSIAQKALTMVDKDDTSLDASWLSAMAADDALQGRTSMSKDAKRFLQFQLNNIEEVKGADLADLSARHWDASDRHAFEGEHALLKEGFGPVIDHMVEKLKRFGHRFRLHMSFEVADIQYGRETETQTYIDAHNSGKRVDLSDACRVLSHDSKRAVTGDFIVCSVPLGVLKQSIDAKSTPTLQRFIRFEPSLPPTKQNAIHAVGFGLVNKIILRFPTAFWRIVTDGASRFGNISGVNPRFYQFIDIGMSFDKSDNAPAILMTTISGRVARKAEDVAEDDIVNEVMSALVAIFGPDVPPPIGSFVSRWGSDPLSQGSHTFLPPGVSDRDLQILQSPVNSNGDSLLLPNSETLRLFFCGEHTSIMYPGTAHGAMLSGLRAAEDVLDAISFAKEDDPTIDRTLPVSIYRMIHPSKRFICELCEKDDIYDESGQGPLLCFSRGSRLALVHLHCARSSSAVAEDRGIWRGVIHSCNVARSVLCVSCKRSGASIYCGGKDCPAVYHFDCAQRSGWTFDEENVEFLCLNHRTKVTNGSAGGESGIQHALFRSFGGVPPVVANGHASSLGKRSHDEVTTTKDSPKIDTRYYDYPLQSPTDWTRRRFVRSVRASTQDAWSMVLGVNDQQHLVVKRIVADRSTDIALHRGDVIVSLNGDVVSSAALPTLGHLLERLQMEVDVVWEVER